MHSLSLLYTAANTNGEPQVAAGPIESSASVLAVFVSMSTPRDNSCATSSVCFGPESEDNGEECTVVPLAQTCSSAVLADQHMGKQHQRRLKVAYGAAFHICGFNIDAFAWQKHRHDF
ncbi:hypothetical protein B0J13DRAFT_519226 [Dactylonectria estremocensis]|uniref:Uncharacterized protein n=1 Tax=Dactylonectria estremocensis TaxID=1079267 RepID=A0A9P9FCD8_9HYPO|nr:hypothetical protein B0J13DRAFT_519226 [Dactylonectria estremocensis]